MHQATGAYRMWKSEAVEVWFHATVLPPRAKIGVLDFRKATERGLLVLSDHLIDTTRRWLIPRKPAVSAESSRTCRSGIPSPAA